MENVKGLVHIQRGAVLQKILELLKRCGYQVFYTVLNSLHYGVPQSRERVYFVGIRNDLYKEDFVFPEPTENSCCLKDFLIDNDEVSILRGNVYKTFLRYLENKYNRGKYNLNVLLEQDYLVLDTRQSDLRLYYDRIPTLRTGRQGILYIKNAQIRRISPLEALLLQGFDKELAQKAQKAFSATVLLSQAGNAMTVSVMKAIGRAILEYVS